MTLWIIYLTSTHPKLSKNVYKKKKWATTVCLQEPNVPFCGVLNELSKSTFNAVHFDRNLFSC